MLSLKTSLRQVIVETGLWRHLHGHIIRDNLDLDGARRHKAIVGAGPSTVDYHQQLLEGCPRTGIMSRRQVDPARSALEAAHELLELTNPILPLK